MPRVSQLVVYPIKSMGGAVLDRSEVGPRGLLHDRRWMLVDEDDRFMTQRVIAKMCLFRASFDEHHLRVRVGEQSVVLPLIPQKEPLRVTVWKSECDAVRVSDEADAWFSEKMGADVRLVYMPDDSIRPTHPDYTLPGDHVGFADAFPVLVASLASLEDLNSRLEAPLPMDRFRANIILEDCRAFEEDEWPLIEIGDVRFRAAKQCGRCLVTTTNQETAEVGTEPLRTLAKYRQQDKAVVFGNYFVPETNGHISVGDIVRIG